MTNIRHRPDTVQRFAKAVLDAGLKKQIDDINLDLVNEAEGFDFPTWRLPDVDPDSIQVVAQATISVDDCELDDITPLIRIEPEERVHRPITAGKVGQQTVPLRIHTFLTLEDIGVDEPEASLMDAIAALNDAIHWALVAGLPGMPGYDGITQTVDDARMHDNVDAENPDAEPVIAVAVEGRMVMTVRLRRLWRR